MRAAFLIGILGMIASAQAAAVSPLGKSDLPIEINSDNLEVRQEENTAVFTGHVVAIQGDVRLRAEKMTVFYRPQEDKKQAAPGQNAIQRIDVDGNVFLTTKEETASGAHGVYDVESREIRLERDVVLTRGKNTLKGDKLVYNLDTGKSILGASAQQAGQAKGGKERVRALFVPDKKEEKK